jgi:hypothetical protein
LIFQYKEKLKQDFIKSITTAKKIFDKDAFRNLKPKVKKYNRALFEAWTVNLSQLTDEERRLLVSKKALVKKTFESLLDNNQAFSDSISKGTSQIQAVKTRFAELEQLIRNILDNPSIRE